MSKLSQAAHVYTDGGETRKRWIIFAAGILVGLASHLVV
jgi:hypothetical protein